MLALFLSALLLQPPTPIPCEAVRVSLGEELAPWIEPVPATPLLRPGIAYTVSPAAPLTIEIATAGTYGFALDQGAWLDVARDGQMLRSGGHGHGPQCVGMRKVVEFALAPGRYTITLSRTQATAIRLFVLPAELLRE